MGKILVFIGALFFGGAILGMQSAYTNEDAINLGEGSVLAEDETVTTNVQGESKASIRFHKGDKDDEPADNEDEGNKVSEGGAGKATVDGTESMQNQSKAPKTGDASNMPFILLGLGSLLVLLLLIRRKRKV